MLTHTRTYRILAVEQGEEEYREYAATAISEALTMAERDDAGRIGHAYTYGVMPEDYDIAREEGIRFNQADGLLI